MNPALTLHDEVRDLFSDSYADARFLYLDLVEQCRLPKDLLSYRLDGSHCTEVAWFGPASASKVAVLISGTHGVEGFLGAAVQADWLEHSCRLPPDTAMLMIFALNPHGFAHSRRCDEQGIDLNRNFIDFSRPLPQNPGYETLRESIYCPDAQQRKRQLEQFERAWGAEAYQIAISGGQYTDPGGPFYGGSGPAHGNRVVEQVIERHHLAGRHLAVVDIHSGLGPYGHGELINDHPLNSSGFHVANRWFGASVASPAVGDSSSVRKEGLLDYRWHALMQERGCFVTLEFGSYPVQALFDVVLDDHCAWKSGEPEAIRKSAAAMREHFCPADGYWRELVLVKSRQVIQQAMDGLENA